MQGRNSNSKSMVFLEDHPDELLLGKPKYLLKEVHGEIGPRMEEPFSGNVLGMS